MSVASRNLFALLDEDEGSSPQPPVADAAKAPVVAPTKKEFQKGPRGGRYYQRGGGTRSAPREDEAPAQGATTGTGDRFTEHTDRGRGRGRGGRGRGEGRGRGGRDSRPDRHSQTGRTDTEKRVSSGWGAEEGRSELAAEQSGAADATADAQANADWGTNQAAATADWGDNQATADWGSAPPVDSWAAPEGGEAKEGEEGERRQREEEEDNTMTLDEYLAKKKASEALPSKPEGRAANEGADNTLWKDAIQLQRDSDEENYFVGKTKSAPKARTEKKEKIHIEIEARFAPVERGRGRGGDRGRGDRGDRGRGRGGRGRGGAEYGRSGRSDANLDVSDETAFPSLS